MKNIKTYSLLVMCSLLSHFLFAGNANNKPKHKYSDTTFVFKNDDPIVMMLDSLQYMKLWESNATPDISKLNIYNYASDEVPTFEDIVYEARIAKLDAASPINLDYHPTVKPYIDMYMFKRRSQVSKLLGLSKLYFPMFEQELDKYNLPLELKNLAVIESALNPVAGSRVGATGLWQFMYGTGKMFGLNVTSYVDERRDPFKSTEAACKYFQYLYNMFGDWQLVLAAYNSGPGTVNRAIRKSGGKHTYWEIRQFLPRETQGYVPAFIAANYVMNYATEHNLYPLVPKHEFFQIEKIKVSQKVSFAQLSEVLNISVEELRYLNPSYKSNVVPFDEEGNDIVLPHNKIGPFINNEQAIYNYRTPEEKIREIESENARTLTYKEVGKIHKVRKGENLKTIANKYGISTSQLKEWNRKRISGSKVKAGQKLTVYVKIPVYLADVKNNTAPIDSAAVVKIDKSLTEQEPSNNNNTSIVNAETEETKEENTIEEPKKIVAKNSKTIANLKNSKPKIVYYKVNRGDTLWSIASKYPGTTVKEIKNWNKLKNNNSLKAGMKVKLMLNS